MNEAIKKGLQIIKERQAEILSILENAGSDVSDGVKQDIVLVVNKNITDLNEAIKDTENEAGN